MKPQTVVALGSGVFCGSFAGLVTALAARPLVTTAVVAAGGGFVGVVVGTWVLTVDRLARLASTRAGKGVLYALILLPLGWLALKIFQGEISRTFFSAMLLPLYGWIVVGQVAENAGTDGDERTGERLVTLPQITPSGLSKRWKRFAYVLYPVLIGLTLLYSTSFGDLWFTVEMLIISAGVFLPKPSYTVHITERGLCSENALGSSVPLGTTFIPWAEVSDYELTGDELTITTEQDEFTYDRARIDDIDRVLDIFERSVPQLERPVRTS